MKSLSKILLEGGVQLLEAEGEIGEPLRNVERGRRQRVRRGRIRRVREGRGRRGRGNQRGPLLRGADYLLIIM